MHVLENNLFTNTNALNMLANSNEDEELYESISYNPNAVQFLKNNINLIDRFALLQNPSIFNYNYKKIRKERKALNDEIIKEVHNPKRVSAFLDSGGEIEDYLN